MFHSAALKLTGWYLLIIMALSIGFSASIYRVSSADLAHDTERQIAYYNGFLGPEDLEDYAHLRQAQLVADQHHLQNRLLLFNLVVLAGGGIVSYALARRTLRPIEESLDLQKRFTADASHELRTPLTVMQAEIEVALRDPKLTRGKSKQLLASNLEEVAKLKNLAEGLLRLANGGKDLQMQAISINQAAALAVERNRKAATVKQISLNNQVKDQQVRGDLESLAELISILVDNAIKYSPAGSKVTLSSARKGKMVRLSVADRGIGIGRADLPRVFDRFYRADVSRSKNRAQGYGLGLAIAKKIADLHNAVIEVRSSPGKGSTFTINIPSL